MWGVVFLSFVDVCDFEGSPVSKRMCLFCAGPEVVELAVLVLVEGACGRRTRETISRTMMPFIAGWVWRSWSRWYDAREARDFSVSPCYFATDKDGGTTQMEKYGTYKFVDK